MILESMNEHEISDSMYRSGTVRRLITKTQHSEAYAKAKKAAKELAKRYNAEYPVVLKTPYKSVVDHNEYYSVFVIPKKGIIEFSNYLRVYNSSKRSYIYYTMPIVGLDNRPQGYCFRFSQHFIDKIQAGRDEHFLVSLNREFRNTNWGIPSGGDPGLKIWIPVKSGVILMIDNVFVSYYRDLKDFGLERRAQYKEFHELAKGVFETPTLLEILVRMKRGAQA